MYLSIRQNKEQCILSTKITWMLDSSSLIRDNISAHALVNSEKLGFEVHMSRMIFMARFRTLTPVSLILSATFSKYCKKISLGPQRHSNSRECYITITIREKGQFTFKPTSGCDAICLPTSSSAASLTDIAESQNLPSTAN